jgi:hypothetical protein
MNTPRRSVLGAIVTDTHFWVPVVVLLAGLLLLVVFGGGSVRP